LKRSKRQDKKLFLGKQFPEQPRFAPELDKMIAQFRKGDELVVWRLDRLGRSLKHIIDLVLNLSEEGITIRGITDRVDTSTINGRLFLNIMASLAEYERELISESQRSHRR
jgi:DNA invertase Pin-like site-specific DNA recombinase